jgi:hypothetical protein
VPRNHACVPETGVPVELNVPPKIDSTLDCSLLD